MPMTRTPPESAAAPVCRPASVVVTPSLWPHAPAPGRAAGQTGDKAIDTGAVAGENEEHGGDKFVNAA